MVAPPFALERYEMVAFAALCKAMRGTNLQARQPSYTYPSYWSRPIFQTAYLPVPGNTDWMDLVVLTPPKQYVSIVQQYAATSLGDISLSGLLFRMQRNGTLLDVTIAPGVEFNKTSANAYPIIPRKIFIHVNNTQRLVIQVKNPTGVQAVAIGMFGGWSIEAMDANVTSDSNAMVDNRSNAFVGGP